MAVTTGDSLDKDLEEIFEDLLACDNTASPEKKTAVKDTKGHDFGVLISEACLSNNMKRLKALILKFNIDLKQVIYFPYAGKMTPLTFAVKNNKFDAVQCLVSCGARVDTVPVPGSTILHTACQNADLDIVVYLVAHGANITTLDDSKKTCLMAALGNTNVCKYLLSKGVNVNAQDINQQTALHHAVKQSYFEATKTLIAFGADVNIKDSDGVDAFHLSAICYRKSFMEYFIENVNVPVMSVANGYCLLEAESLCKNDQETAIDMLSKAVAVKCPQEWEDTNKTDLCDILSSETEIKAVDELLCSMVEREKKIIQAILIYQRILGGHHQKTASCLRLFYQIVMKRKEIRKGGEILNYIYTEVLRKKAPFYFDCLLAYQQLIKHTFSLSRNDIETSKMFELFTNLVCHIETANRYLDRWSRDELQKFDRLIVDTVGVLITLSNLITDEKDRNAFLEEIRKLVKIDPRGLNSVTILHTVLNYDWKSIGFELAEPQKTSALIQMLIECGASVNATDDKRNTPLHTVLMCYGYVFEERLPDQEDVVSRLVECGTHMDALNSRHQTVLSLMKTGGYQICDVKYITLQCLAASVITKHSIPYQGTVPKSIIPFIKMHGKVETGGFRDWTDRF